MSYVTYGYGRDVDTIGSITTFGLGRVPIAAVISGSIIMGIDLDYQAINQLDASVEILFDTDLDLNISKYLQANPEIAFITNLDIDTLNQLVGNSGILFNIDLSAESAKQLDTNINVDFDIILDMEVVNFLLEFGLDRLNLYIIEEELRFLPVYMELRNYLVKADIRTDTIMEEDRIMIIPKIKEDN